MYNIVLVVGEGILLLSLFILQALFLCLVIARFHHKSAQLLISTLFFYSVDV